MRSFSESVQAEKQEKEIDNLIERRAVAAKKNAEAERIEALWAESSRKARKRREGENRALWYAHHMSMCAVHTGLAQDHERKALELLEEEAS